MAYRLEILGEPRIVSSKDATDASLSLGKPLALLSYLVVEGREVPREELGTLFWPGSTPSRARQSVRQALWLLKRTLGEDVLTGNDPVAASTSLSSDLADLHDALEDGGLDEARRLWRGPLLAHLALPDCREWDRWLEEKREVLRRRLFQALLDGARLLRAEGKHEEARGFLEEALSLAPYSVEARVAHMETLLDLNRLGPAREALEEARREVGDRDDAKEPFAELEERLQALLSKAAPDDLQPLGSSMEFVGRSRELAELKSAWRRTRSGRTGVVAVSGPAGIGKSRLALEFLKHVEAEGGQVARARGHRGEEEIRLGAVADLAAALMGLPGAAGVSPGAEAVLGSILPSLSPNGSPGASGTGVEPAALSDALADLLEAVGFEGPLVVLLDDVHWMDEESRALLSRLLRRIRHTPCLFVLAMRRYGGSDGEPSGSPGLSLPEEARRIPLESLDETTIRELLTLLAEVRPTEAVPGVVQRIARASGGNPLFIAELLRTLAEDGVCRKEGRGWVFEAERMPPQLELPESILELIGERLERLSPEANQIADTLARERREVPTSELRRRAGLDETSYTRAVGELLGREVVVWVGENALDFIHDQLREVVAVRATSSPRPSAGPPPRRAPWQTAAWVAVLILAGVGAWQVAGALSPGPNQDEVAGTAGVDAATYPYGRGVVLVLSDPPVELVPPETQRGEWTERPTSIYVPSEAGARVVDGPYRTAAGELRWFGYVSDGEEPPYAVEFLPDGSLDVIRRGDTDVGFRSLSPDGRLAVLMEERAGAEPYAQNLILQDLENEEDRVLMRSGGMTYGGLWSPDGQRIAAGSCGMADTLRVLSPEGSVLASHVFPGYDRIRAISWCPDSRRLAVVVLGEDGDYGLLLDPFPGTTVPFGGEFWGLSSALCLGEGASVLYVGASEEGVSLVVEDPRKDSVPLLRRWPDLPQRATRWIPDSVPAPVRRVGILAPEPVMIWGERRRFGVEGIRTDGGREEVPVRWTSRDPGVASVAEDGLVTANRSGEATLVAEYMGWLRDSVAIHVRDLEGDRRDVLFRESFASGELARWDVSGSHPPPAVVEVAGGTALSHRGDGRFSDPILTRESFSLDQGGTLELEFRLPLTARRDRQHLQVCLLEESAFLPDEASAGVASRSGPRFCFRVPEGELQKRRRDRAQLWLGNNLKRAVIDVGSRFPSDDWVHLALQLRADGLASVFLHRELAYTSSLRIPVEAGGRWRIELSGAAVDTELLVRHLVLWRGERFSIGGPPPGG